MTEGEELAALISERNITISGEPLIVREYTLKDSLQLHPFITAFTESLADVMEGHYPSLDEVSDVLAKHADIIPHLVAGSIDKAPEWVSQLPGTEGQTLLDWWWTVNRSFFISAAVRRITIRDTLSAAATQKSSQR